MYEISLTFDDLNEYNFLFYYLQLIKLINDRNVFMNVVTIII